MTLLKFNNSKSRSRDGRRDPNLHLLPPLQRHFYFQPSFLILFTYLSAATAPSPALRTPPRPPIPKTHWHPHPFLVLHLCLSRPAAPCRVKWTVPVSGESRALRSAQHGSAGLPAFQTYCVITVGARLLHPGGPR